jgi:hypothetical protein
MKILKLGNAFVKLGTFSVKSGQKIENFFVKDDLVPHAVPTEDNFPPNFFCTFSSKIPYFLLKNDFIFTLCAFFSSVLCHFAHIFTLVLKFFFHFHFLIFIQLFSIFSHSFPFTHPAPAKIVS